MANKLKTLQDIFDIEDHEDIVHINMLRREAIKMASLFGGENAVENITQEKINEIFPNALYLIDEYPGTSMCLIYDFIKYFFNIDIDDIQKHDALVSGDEQ